MTDPVNTADRPTTAPAKVADRPHRWTVGLSLFAAFISLTSATFSYLSLRETQHNNKVNQELNEKTSRAYLSVSHLVLDGSLFATKNWASEVKGQVTVANNGRTAAQQVDTLLSLNPPRAENWFEIAQFEEIPPGVSKTVRVTFNTGRSVGLTHLNDSGEYVVMVQLTYGDGLHNEKQEQSTMFCLSETSKLPKSIELYPCDVHFDDGDNGEEKAH